MGHEAQRQQMIYLAAWYVSNDKHWFDLYKEIRDEGIELAKEKTKLLNSDAYIMLQAQCSVRLLYELDPDEEYKKEYYNYMMRLAKHFSGCIIDTKDWSEETMNATFEDWRKYPARYECKFVMNGYAYFIPEHEGWKRKELLGTRAISSALCIEALCPGFKVPKVQIETIKEMLAFF